MPSTRSVRRDFGRRGLRLLDNRWVSRLGAVHTLWATALLTAGIVGGVVAVTLTFPPLPLAVTMAGVFALVGIAGTRPVRRRQACRALNTDARALTSELVAWLHARLLRYPSSGATGGLRDLVHRYERESPEERAERQRQAGRLEQERQRFDSDTLAEYHEKFEARGVTILDRATALQLVGAHADAFRKTFTSPQDQRDLIKLAELLVWMAHKADPSPATRDPRAVTAEFRS